jgi:hypothetical protein
MRSSAALASVLLVLDVAASAVAADDPRMKQAQWIFQPTPIKPPAIKDVPATPAIIDLGKALYFDRGCQRAPGGVIANVGMMEEGRSSSRAPMVAECYNHNAAG